MGGRGSGSGLSASTSFQGADASTQGYHRQQVETLGGDQYPNYKTYDLDTLQIIDYPDGYQVTFSQIGDNYSPTEYANKVNEFLAASSDGKTCGGKFEGTPEISFHVSNRSTAIRLAKKYNQISVWDWENANEIKTGGTGRK